MSLLILLFGLLSDSFLAALVGIIGSRRRIGFGWSLLISLIFTPLIGIICVLCSDRLPRGENRWGCLGTLMAIAGFVCLAVFLLLLLGGGALIAAL